MLESKEFAKYLIDLCENSGKFTDQTDTNSEDGVDLIAQWLLPTLGNRSSQMATPAEFPVVSKKIRDEILGDRKPFRRSAYWTISKVLLQLGLTIEYGGKRGILLYKLIMLRYFVFL